MDFVYKMPIKSKLKNQRIPSMMLQEHSYVEILDLNIIVNPMILVQ